MGGLCKTLRVGQLVNLRELDRGLEVSVLASGGTGLRIAEIGSDYLLIEDEAAELKRQVPMYMVESVVLPTDPLPQVA